MNKLLIITFIDFWRNGAGNKTRLCSLINYLKDKVKLTVFYFASEVKPDKIRILKYFPGIEFYFSSNDPTSTLYECGECLEVFLKDKMFDKVLVEYVEASFILKYLPSSVTTILDTHDILHDKIKSFKQAGLEYHGIQLGRKQELQIYSCYDYVMLIQGGDYRKISGEIGADRTLLVPHAVNSAKKVSKDKVKIIGYIGSEYAPNFEALRWFLQEVWPFIYERYRIAFAIFGNICHTIYAEMRNTAGVEFKGFIDDIEIAYDYLDIVVNPIRVGAGLKIKNIEALGYGMPLVTTSHGASGIEKGASKAYLVADTIEQFHFHIGLLINDFELRREISNNAFEFAKKNFSPDISYQSLLNVLRK